MNPGNMELMELYNYYNTDLADSRVSNWWLISSPIPIILIQLSYLYFVMVCGPRYMQNRRPYSLKTFITCYNVFQIFANALLVHGAVTTGWKKGLTLGCEIMEYSADPISYQMAGVIWWTFLLKLIDLIETVVFVLRKKDNQISFLHLYHHMSTLSIAWLITKYMAGGMCLFSIVVNSSVHVVMYTYYLLASRGPRIQRLISPIKPYITIIQMIQFCMLLTHSAQGLLPSCKIPISAPLLYIGNILINFYLFYNFYQKNYVQTKKKL